jgi:predicted ATPase
MITRFRLENFKAHRDTDLALHQFTVLVGDNGSGKTSVLEALYLPHVLRQPPEPQVQRELLELVRRDTNQTKLSWEGKALDQRWVVSMVIDTFRPTIDMPRGELRGLHITGEDASGAFNYDPRKRRAGLGRVEELIERSALYHFRADQVAASAYGDKPQVAVAEDGAQTAVVLADLKLADDERFHRIEEALRSLVPSLERLRIAPAMVEHRSNSSPVRGSKVYFDFRGATNVPGHHASQGTLVVLALLTVLHGPNRPRLILLDDFDHSLHPRAQMELVRMIKDLLALDAFKDTQIVATTHSPFVLDEVSPSDVIAFALRDDGTVAAKPLSEHPDAPRVNGSLKAGELWTLDAERDWVR